jgi:SagB-type dehydrogenase family enzyme
MKRSLKSNTGFSEPGSSKPEEESMPGNKAVSMFAVVVLISVMLVQPSGLHGRKGQETIDLPEVKPGAPGSFSDLMHRRRSIRTYAQGHMTLDQLSRVVFAAQGITRQGFYRTVPSAGALYPLEVFVVTGPVQGLDQGVYRYSPEDHELVPVASGDRRKDLARQAYGQMWVAEAQVVMVICAVYERVTGKYGRRGERYVHMEAGCAAQNIALEGIDLGLGSTVVGAFNDGGVAEVIEAGEDEKPLIVMPVGLMN